MTEHFTREEAVALAKAAGFEVRRGLGLRESVPEDVFARGLINEEVTALCNAAAVAAKLKGWDVQGAAAKCVWGGKIEHLHEGPPSKLVGALLYTHALPAQPAEPAKDVGVLVEALERKLPGGKQTDDFESSRIGDYNQGWNDYRKAVKKMFKNINMNSSENSNPDAYLYSLEYGEKVVDTKVSIHQLNYPFGVAGADYLVRNDDGVSYVRQTKLYAALSRAQAARDLLQIHDTQTLTAGQAAVADAILAVHDRIDAGHFARIAP